MVFLVPFGLVNPYSKEVQSEVSFKYRFGTSQFTAHFLTYFIYLMVIVCQHPRADEEYEQGGHVDEAYESSTRF